jgi:nucleotide-binding universal stress UspA family protein
MTTPNHAATQRPFVLVLGLDLADTASSGYAFDQAARIAARIEGSQIHPVYALPEEAGQAVLAEASGLMGRYIGEKVAALGVAGPIYHTHVRRGDAARAIAQTAADVGADLIVVGAHKAPRLKTLVLGSTAERVMSNTQCPVMVAGPRPAPEPPHVIIIEPPCPDCVRRRAETANRDYWCARHSENHHLHRHHVYSYAAGVPFQAQDASVDLRGD